MTSKQKQLFEFTAVATVDIIQTLYEDRKSFALCHLNWYKKTGLCVPSGKLIRRGRHLYSVVDVILLAIILNLGSEGVAPSFYRAVVPFLRNQILYALQREDDYKHNYIAFNRKNSKYVFQIENITELANKAIEPIVVFDLAPLIQVLLSIMREVNNIPEFIQLQVDNGDEWRGELYDYLADTEIVGDPEFPFLR